MIINIITFMTNQKLVELEKEAARKRDPELLKVENDIKVVDAELVSFAFLLGRDENNYKFNLTA